MFPCHFDIADEDTENIAARLFPLVFRRDFSAPGFALVSIPQHLSSTSLRRFMLDLMVSLRGVYQHSFQQHLGCFFLARFNQQVTTKFHLDGAPLEAYLMLGYEPTRVRSALAIADYTRAAHEAGMDVATLLADFNPMFGPHEALLVPYITRLPELDPSQSHILLINNSSLSWDGMGRNSLGVMHQATILTPDAQASRVVNSLMMAPISAEEEQLGADWQDRFATTSEVAGEIKAAG